MSIKHCSFVFTLLVTLVVSTVKAADNLKPILTIEHWNTKSGVPVYFVAKSQIPIVDISVLFHAGSAHDHASPGIAYFTAQMLDQGTQDLNANHIANGFETVGARYNTAINQDMAIINLRSLSTSQSLNPALNLFAKLFKHTNFPQEAVNQVKKQTEIALQQEAQTPNSLALKAFYQALYGPHPYASPPLGTITSIEKISREKLLLFYRHYYVSKNALIAIVGNLTKDKAIHIAEQLASALPTGEKAAPLPLPTLQQHMNHILKISYPSQQTTIILGQIGITLKDPDYFPLILGNQILGGGILTSRLFTEVRNKRGLCYGISSRFNTLSASGPFLIGLQTRRKQAATALSITQNTLNNFVAHGPTEKELIAAKQALTASFPLTIANNAAILATLEKIGFYQLPLNYLDTYQSNINQVTLKQVYDAFQKHIKPEKMLTVILGKY